MKEAPSCQDHSAQARARPRVTQRKPSLMVHPIVPIRVQLPALAVTARQAFLLPRSIRQNFRGVQSFSIDSCCASDILTAVFPQANFNEKGQKSQRPKKTKNPVKKYFQLFFS